MARRPEALGHRVACPYGDLFTASSCPDVRATRRWSRAVARDGGRRISRKAARPLKDETLRYVELLPEVSDASH